MVGDAVIMASSKFKMEPVMRVATLKKTEIYGDEEQRFSRQLRYIATLVITLHVLKRVLF